MNNIEEIHFKVNQLIEGWCEHRRLKPLRYILQNYPPLSGLTDEWGALLEALKDVKGFCAKELTEQEAKLLSEVIVSVDSIVYRKNSDSHLAG